MDYEKLATEQFYELKEETLDDDRHSLGAGGEKEYEIDGIKFTIKVDGFWESSTWFDWFVYDEHGTRITSGTKA